MDGASLADRLASAPFVWVAGKGGTGKTTAAGALALAIARRHGPTHLISTDPAHSIGDLFRQHVSGDVTPSDCTADLTLEAFDAAAFGAAWMAGALEPVTRIVELGTYLDGEDVASFARLALPGIDEMMAVLRLVDLARAGTRVVVDTAPTGHTLRLLDASETHAGIARALRAMADKAAAVAGSFARRQVSVKGEEIITALEEYVRDWRSLVLDPALFVVATRSGPVVSRETNRLRSSLADRRLQVAAVIHAAAAGQDRAGAATGPDEWLAPFQPDVRGCDALDRWLARLEKPRPVTDPPAAPLPPAARPPQHDPAGPARGAAAADRLIGEPPPRLLLFAGKGGVGKSTCAAACALHLAAGHDVLLCSADPAGSLEDVLDGDRAPRLRVLQIDPGAELAQLRAAYSADAEAALERIGLAASATLDRRVIESLWDLTPPGIDELAAVSTMLDAAEDAGVVVLDTAPTGHFLRLLATPATALDWTHQLMRVIVKYGIAGSSGGAAEALLRLARSLRALESLLHDPERAAVVVVTLDEPVVAAETDRLLARLADGGPRVAGVVVNRAAATAGNGPHVDVRHAVVRAPLRAEPPTGANALLDWLGDWRA